MGEDQHADRAAGLHEAGGGDRLARRRRVFEAVAAALARIGRSRAPRRPRPPRRPHPRRRPPRSSASLVLVVVLVVVFVLVSSSSASRSSAATRRVVSSSPFLVLALGLGVLGVTSRSSSPISAASMPARASTWCARRVRPDAAPAGRREHALEAQHEREAEAPGRARGVEALRDLLARCVERATARRARRERHRAGRPRRTATARRTRPRPERRRPRVRVLPMAPARRRPTVRATARSFEDVRGVARDTFIARARLGKPSPEAPCPAV